MFELQRSRYRTYGIFVSIVFTAAISSSEFVPRNAFVVVSSCAEGIPQRPAAQGILRKQIDGCQCRRRSFLPLFFYIKEPSLLIYLRMFAIILYRNASGAFVGYAKNSQSWNLK